MSDDHDHHHHHDHDESESWPKQPMVPLEKPYVDSRGVIQNLVETMMRSAVLITSVKGAVRANHYHKTDWHYCYVLEGSIEYYHRAAGSQDEPECLMVRKGEMVFTPPLVEHCMKFPEDSTFLTLSRNARDHAAYEEDVVRVILVP